MPIRTHENIRIRNLSVTVCGRDECQIRDEDPALRYLVEDRFNGRRRPWYPFSVFIKLDRLVPQSLLERNLLTQILNRLLQGLLDETTIGVIWRVALPRVEDGYRHLRAPKRSVSSFSDLVKGCYRHKKATTGTDFGYHSGYSGAVGQRSVIPNVSSPVESS
jgi:hypothetical protein